MIGLLRKDLYIIVKNFKPVQFLPLMAPIFVAVVNPAYLMPILSIMISMLFTLQVSQTMSLDEKTKWPKNITAMPISHLTEAGSKFLLLLFMTVLSTILVLIIGMISCAAQLITNNTAWLYTGLSFAYALLYGSIIIPASYRFGADNSKYIFMLFIFLPTLILVVFQSNNISMNFEWLMSMSVPRLIALVALIMTGYVTISLYLSVRILKNQKYRRL